MCLAGAQGLLSKLQEILAAAAKPENGTAARSCSLTDLFSLCLLTLAYICELNLSKDPASVGKMLPRLADPLTDAIMKVSRRYVIQLHHNNRALSLDVRTAASGLCCKWPQLLSTGH